jgi:hypothetical protein
MKCNLIYVLKFKEIKTEDDIKLYLKNKTEFLFYIPIKYVKKE